MNFKTLREIKQAYPEFFGKDVDRHHGTRKIYKRGDCLITENKLSERHPTHYAIYYCDWEDIHFVEHQGSMALAEVVAALVNRIGIEEYRKSKEANRGT